MSTELFLDTTNDYSILKFKVIINKYFIVTSWKNRKISYQKYQHMYNSRQYLLQLNYYKSEEKCIKFIKHFKSKKNNLKST